MEHLYSTAADSRRASRVELRQRRSGELDFELAAVESEPPRPGEVAVQVFAAGLNFPDVLTAMGLSAAYFEDPPRPGLECAGVVTAAGPGVTAFEVGDRVVAVVEGAFASEINVPVTSVMPVPDRMDFAQAATVPVAFLTAWYGLVRMAGIQRGERLLIHSAAGGVGSAALAIAKLRGAEVLATAGTPEKRTYLHERGVRHVMDSHSAGFGDETLAATGGEGVDVVLNSLTGELLRRGLELLRVRGRFVEIGKRDIMADSALGLGPFRNSLSMHSVDLRLLVDRCPDLIGDILAELAPLFASGALAPLPYTPFPATRADSAFRKMMGGRHIGKIVLTFA
ncbi:zinc-binding dehydrogenase [Streptomyces sp. NBC_01235]|uniref:zinc-binding dehydrogenase n=1 Tax=Streptomyces sp. NBC_01235 TaxID=2903788 RepID=UPI002E0FEF62|nr:zinc-binding dehydrogenase [Streptomyces sp. NBC_01235]